MPGTHSAVLDAEQRSDAIVPDDWRTRTTVPVPTGGRILGIGRNAAYNAAAKGDLPTIRLGCRLVVPVAQLRRLLGETP